MKNKFIIIIFLTFFFQPLFAENLNIQSLSISVDKKRKSNCIIFHSDMWHRVRPVKSGVRKSLVGWLVGPQFR